MNLHKLFDHLDETKQFVQKCDLPQMRKKKNIKHLDFDVLKRKPID